MREKGQTEVAKTLETPVFSRGIEILTEKIEFIEYHNDVIFQGAWDKVSVYRHEGKRHEQRRI